MKLRVKGNTLRLRLNQSEVRNIAAGGTIQERITFPGSTGLAYVLKPANSGHTAAFSEGVITISASTEEFQSWAASEELGLYFDIPADQEPLKVAIEKDLECVDAPPSERDADAFPRAGGASSCS